MKFKQWLKGYEVEYKEALKEWQETSKMKSIIPKGFGDRLLRQYAAYRNELMTKRLVIATWILAIATLILSILTLMFK